MRDRVPRRLLHSWQSSTPGGSSPPTAGARRQRNRSAAANDRGGECKGFRGVGEGCVLREWSARVRRAAHAQVAQLVEQRTENPCVDSSTLSLGTRPTPHFPRGTLPESVEGDNPWFATSSFSFLAVGAVTGGYFLGTGNWNIGGAAPWPSSPARRRAPPWPAMTSSASACPSRARPRARARRQVTIVEFSDFQCPYCSRVLPTLDKLLKEYPDKVRVFFRHNPLPFHSDAPAGVAGRGGRRDAGQVLADARHPVQEPAEPEAPGSREVRGRDRPRHGQVQEGHRRARDQEAGRRRPRAGQEAGRAGHPELLHQRPPGSRRRALRAVQDARSTTSSRAARSCMEKGVSARQGLRGADEGRGQGPRARRRRRPRRPASPSAPRSTRSSPGNAPAGRRQGAQDHAHRVLRVPVPVLLARQGHAG